VKTLFLTTISLIATIGLSGCQNPAIVVRYPDEHVATKAGDLLVAGGNTHTTRYDGVWMRNEVDKALHDAKWKRFKK
jgi:hypothetical protein